MSEDIPTNPPISEILKCEGAKEAYRAVCNAVGKPYLDSFLLNSPLAPQGYHKPTKEAQKTKAQLEDLANRLSACAYQLENSPACHDVRIETRHFKYKGARLVSLMRLAARRLIKEAQRPKLLPLFDECHYRVLVLLRQAKLKTGRLPYLNVSHLLHARMEAARLHTDGKKKLWCSPEALKMLWHEAEKNRGLWKARSSSYHTDSTK